MEQWWAVKSAACDAIVDQRRHDHPSPRDRPRPRPLDAARDRRHRHRGAARREGAARPGRDPEPRQGAAVRSRPETNMHEALGIEIEEAGRRTSSRAGLPVTDQVRQPFGLVHGGALLTLAESLTSFGTWHGREGRRPGRDGPGDQRQPDAPDHRGPRERDRHASAAAAAPPGSGRSRSPTTTAASAR